MRRLLNKLRELFARKRPFQPWPVEDDPHGPPEWWDEDLFETWASYAHADDCGWDRLDEVLAAIGENLNLPKGAKLFVVWPDDPWGDMP